MTSCRHCGHRIVQREGQVLGPAWTDRIDGADWLGSGEVCPVAWKHEPAEMPED